MRVSKQLLAVLLSVFVTVECFAVSVTASPPSTKVYHLTGGTTYNSCADDYACYTAGKIIGVSFDYYVVYGTLQAKDVGNINCEIKDVTTESCNLIPGVICHFAGSYTVPAGKAARPGIQLFANGADFYVWNFAVTCNGEEVTTGKFSKSTALTMTETTLENVPTYQSGGEEEPAIPTAEKAFKADFVNHTSSSGYPTFYPAVLSGVKGQPLIISFDYYLTKDTASAVVQDVATGTAYPNSETHSNHLFAGIHHFEYTGNAASGTVAPGVQMGPTDFSVIYIWNVKITLNSVVYDYKDPVSANGSAKWNIVDYSAIPFPGAGQEEQSEYVRTGIYHPSTQLICPPTVVGIVDTLKRLNALSEAQPAQNAKISVDENLNVQLRGETEKLSDVLTVCHNTVIPWIEVNSPAAASAVVQYLTEYNIYDTIISSGDLTALSILQNAGLIYTQIAYVAPENKDIATVCDTAHLYGAKIVVLQNPTVQAVRYIQARSLSITAEFTGVTDHKAVYNALATGTDGVILADPMVAYRLYQTVSTENYARKPFTVAHRGLNQIAPENTVEALREAFKIGADAVECDIYRTADDQLVINHDGKIDGYTTGSVTGSVENFTRAQLKSFTLKTVGEYAGCKFAFLDEFFAELAKYPEKILVIEVKGNKSVGNLVASLAKQYGVEHQIVFISFDKNALNDIREALPAAPLSYLTQYSSEIATDDLTELTLANLNGMPSMISPQYGYGAAALYNIRLRGITANFWTPNGLQYLSETVRKGATFVTTDDVDIAVNFLADILKKPEAILGFLPNSGILGDANSDNTVDVRDLVCLKKTLRGSLFVAETADADRSGKTDADDLVVIKQMILEVG